MAKSKKKSASSQKQKNRFAFLKKYFLPAALSTLLLILIFFAYQQFILNKFYPLTFVGNTNISLLTESQAIRKLEGNFQTRAKQKLSFNSPQGSVVVDLATSSAALDYSAVTEEFTNTHNLSFLNRLLKQINSLLPTKVITPKVNISLDKQTDTVATAVDKQPQNAQLIFDENPSSEGSSSAQIQIKEGLDGLTLDKETLKKEITNYLLTGKHQSWLPLKITSPSITTAHVTGAKQALEAIIKEPIKLTFEQNSWTIDAKQLLTLLDLTKGNGELLDKDQTYFYLKKIAGQIDQEVQEGLFEFNPQSKRVTAFKPSQEGRKLNIQKTIEMLSEALGNQTKSITLPVEIVKPKIATSDVNSLGVKELLGRGVSNFAGSITNRIYNVGLTASKINGVLVAPGQTFSFNQTIGDISEATGFKKAYVIKEGRTVLDDGGGVCQVSTTLFRAVLNAGLPVAQRTAHAYRVGYYEQGFPPGLDATVFYPSVDFQFKNDTPNHILVQAYTSGLTVYVDLYGTSDGRVASLTTPVITNQTPPPPELRQDDPTLPKGTVKQVDWAAWGATVAFKRTVTKAGETLANETWKSNYKPWQAVFLVGTQ